MSNIKTNENKKTKTKDNATILVTNKSIKPNDLSNFNECIRLCNLSMKIFNAGIQVQSNRFNNNENYLLYFDLCTFMVDYNNQDYYNLPSRPAKYVLKRVDKSYKSFFNKLKNYNLNPNGYPSRPNPPKERDNVLGFVIEYPKDGVSKTQFINNGLINPSNTNLFIPYDKELINYDNFHGIRIVPKNNKYNIEILYNVLNKEYKDTNIVCGIDLGVNNLATLFIDNPKVQPIIIDGKPIKHKNAMFNKKLKKLRKKIDKLKNERKILNKKEVNDNNIKKLNLIERRITNIKKEIDIIREDRNNYIDSYLHKSSKDIITYLMDNGVSDIVIGKNNGWKLNTGKKGKKKNKEKKVGEKKKRVLSKKVNQSFQMIPYNKLIHMIKYKGVLNGLKVEEIEESFTSLCSYYDKEEMVRKDKYEGKRIYRGLYKTKEGKHINADINGAGNIIRKKYGEKEYKPSEMNYRCIKYNPIKEELKNIIKRYKKAK